MKRIYLFLALALAGSGRSAFCVEGNRSSCEQARAIKQLLHAAASANAIAESAAFPTDASLCASAPPLPEAASLEMVSARWDPVLRAFQFRIRCQSPGTCLPFLVSWPMATPVASQAATLQVRPAPSPHASPPAVKPGQIVTLVWGEGGLRMSRKVVCLDLGREGQQVRTRAPQGGRIVRARVAGAGLVEAGL